jgi:hypothetical protein
MRPGKILYSLQCALAVGSFQLAVAQKSPVEDIFPKGTCYVQQHLLYK